MNAHHRHSPGRDTCDLTDEEIFDEALDAVFEEERARERRGEKIIPAENMDPEVAEAGAALNAIFGGGHHLTADLSFDQVYALVRPHFITLVKHLTKEHRGQSDDDQE